MRPHFLITNDDGIHAPGIKHLWNAIKNKADITVVAPVIEQSATSLSITLRHPLRVEKAPWIGFDVDTWSVNGTPSDCVKMALNIIMKQPPSLILSGINRGSNAGRNMLYSGTVAAVIEGILHDIPGVAFSIGDYHDTEYKHVEEYIPQIINYIMEHPLPLGTFLNVNFPKRHHGPIKGILMTRQGKEYWAENPERRHHPGEGDHYYWLGSRLAQFDEEDDCDISWLNRGYATAVPIHIGELTDRDHIKKQKSIFEEFVKKTEFIPS